MLKSLEMTGANIDEATKNALCELQLDRDSVQVEVIEKETKGLFGIGRKPAKVKVTYEVPDEPVQAAAEKKPQKPEPVSQAPEGKVPAMQEPQEPKPQAAAAQPAQEPVQTDGQLEDAQAKAKSFIDELLAKMGIEGEAFLEEDSREDYIKLDIRGQNMGAVIGRRGDTLDAIQYLTSLYVNKGADNHIRVAVNTENYRARREESLQRLARKMAGKAVKYRRNMTLEPMNPYERRIIHSALQDYSGVTTYSTGSEPNRRIVIAVENAGHYHGRRSRGGYSKDGFNSTQEDEN